MVFLLAGTSYASESELADVNEKYVSGLLPKPYETFSILVKLNKERELSVLDLQVKGKKIYLTEIDFKKIRDFDISELRIEYEIHRSEKIPFEKIDETLQDLLIVKIGSTSSFVRKNTLYKDYYTLEVNLESLKVNLSKFEYNKP